jgi:fructose-specific phosphotransferase system IIC component
MCWLVAGFVMGFAISFVFADVLSLPRDLYYGIYEVAVLPAVGTVHWSIH